MCSSYLPRAGLLQLLLCVRYRQFAVVDEKELEMGIWKRNEVRKQQFP